MRRTWNRSQRRCVSALVAGAVVALFALPARGQDQGGSLAGTVTGPDGAPLANAEVRVIGTRLGTLTDHDGAFRLSGVPAGLRRLRVRQVGYATRVVEDVRVRANETTDVEVSFQRSPFQMDELVVSASRQPEWITEAPATVTKINTEEI